MGPTPLSTQDLEKWRYGITDLIDDIRDPRSRDEMMATASQLFDALANFHLRSRGLWAGKGKSIPRALNRANPELCVRYCHAFDDLFTNGNYRAVIALADEILEANGGRLFEGYRLNAPKEWRRSLHPNAIPEKGDA